MQVKLGEAIGIQPTSDAAKLQLTRYLNTAGREIWGARDMPSSTYEQYFQLPAEMLNTATPIVNLTLPWYCAGVRAIRWSEIGRKITLKDLRPRYQATPWRQPFLTWRIKNIVPLARELSVEGVINFTLATPQTIPITFTVTGPSTTASSAYEQVTILAGNNAASTNTQWAVGGPTRITKSAPLTCDVDLTDAAGEDIGIIAARQEQAMNVLIQVSDDYSPINYTGLQTVEVLYKLPYQELAFDGDVFISTDYEDALVWRARANWAALQSNEVVVQSAALFAAKSDELIAQLSANQESDVEMNMNFAPNRYNNLLAYAAMGRRGFLRRYANF